jgi:hypothetical protein
MVKHLINDLLLVLQVLLLLQNHCQAVGYVRGQGRPGR